MFYVLDGDIDGVGNLLGDEVDRLLADDLADAELQVLVGVGIGGVEQLSLRGKLEQFDQNFIDTFVQLGRSFQHRPVGKVLGKEGFYSLFFAVANDVCLVDDTNHRSLELCNMGDQGEFFLACTALGVEDVEHCIALFKTSQCCLLQALVQRLIAEVKTRRVGEDQLPAAVGIDSPDGVSSRLGRRGGDGDFHLTDGIEQGAFTC
ncbi:hypothetical protein SDC9_54379 [bioreactor metagenome]|uniref:Uncharacterized protein n=1 Tax=bioreactor metagenome TaxID=1076179 RepID=A0A644WWJ5_9ZZZZ